MRNWISELDDRVRYTVNYCVKNAIELAQPLQLLLIEKIKNNWLLNEVLVEFRIWVNCGCCCVCRLHMNIKMPAENKCRWILLLTVIDCDCTFSLSLSLLFNTLKINRGDTKGFVVLYFFLRRGISLTSDYENFQHLSLFITLANNICIGQIA